MYLVLQPRDLGFERCDARTVRVPRALDLRDKRRVCVLGYDGPKAPLVSPEVCTRGVELLLLPTHAQQPRAVRVGSSTRLCTRLALALRSAGACVRRDTRAGEEDRGACVCLADVEPVGGCPHDGATAPRGARC